MNRWPLSTSLTTSTNGEQLANAVLLTIRAGEEVEIDFVDVEVMTPSFANAFVMTLLAQLSLDEIRRHCVMANRPQLVVDLLNRAVTRYQKGIRLSVQLPVTPSESERLPHRAIG